LFAYPSVAIERPELPKPPTKKSENNPNEQGKASNASYKMEGEMHYSCSGKSGHRIRGTAAADKFWVRLLSGWFKLNPSRLFMVETLALFVIFAGVFGTLVYRIGRPNRYAQRTNQEFEEDAKKGSLLGAVVIGLERSLRRREADSMIERIIDKDAHVWLVNRRKIPSENRCGRTYLLAKQDLRP